MKFHTRIWVKVISWQLTTFVISAVGYDNTMNLKLALVDHHRSSPTFGGYCEGQHQSAWNSMYWWMTHFQYGQPWSENEW